MHDRSLRSEHVDISHHQAGSGYCIEGIRGPTVFHMTTAIDGRDDALPAPSLLLSLLSATGMHHLRTE